MSTEQWAALPDPQALVGAWILSAAAPGGRQEYSGSAQWREDGVEFTISGYRWHDLHLCFIVRDGRCERGQYWFDEAKNDGGELHLPVVDVGPPLRLEVMPQGFASHTTWYLRHDGP